MINVALDLSLHSTGYAIANTDTKQIAVGRLCQTDYVVSKAANKYRKMSEDASSIAEQLVKLLMPYRYAPIHVYIEEVAFGYHCATNSVFQLVYESATVAALLRYCLHCEVDFVSATKHKRSFTGRGNAKKEQSVATMLTYYPILANAADKLDDIADALSILSTCIQLTEYRLR